MIRLFFYSQSSNLGDHLYTDSAAGHNSTWRFYDLTDAWNSGDVSRWIASGKFTNIFPGCYIRKTKTIDGVTYTDHIDMIAECDPYLGKWTASGSHISTHHVGIIPYSSLGKSPMYQSSAITGGFSGSYMQNTTLPKYLKGYQDAYDDNHLLSFETLISKTVDSTIVANGCTSWRGGSVAWEWKNAKLTLMSDIQIGGAHIFGNSYDIGEANSQLSIFKYSPSLIHFMNSTFWLRNVSGSNAFATSSDRGYFTSWEATTNNYVRPLLLLY